MKMICRDEIIEMLNIKNGSLGYYELLHKAFNMSKEAYSNKGCVFAQIGLNAEPCSANCKFCSFGEKHFSAYNKGEKQIDEIVDEAKLLIAQNIDDLFLMTTTDYPKDKYLDVISKVKPHLKENMNLVANVGDFDLDYAKMLKKSGINGVYHICRLNEGVDTLISLEERVATIEAIKEVGLELYYCIEPIGPEHTYEQIADEIERAISYNVNIMAVMRRVPIEGTPKFLDGTIDALEFTKIVAVSRIAVNPKKSMNAHETNYMTLLAGVNQLYAEVGANPRDKETETQTSRGLKVEDCVKILKDVGYHV